jgi:hypothetical protein
MPAQPGPSGKDYLDYDIRYERRPRLGRVLIEPESGSYATYDVEDQLLRRGQIGAVGDVAVVIGEAPAETAVRIWLWKPPSGGVTKGAERSA